MNRRNSFQRFWLRLKIAYRIAFKEKHGICVYLTRKQLAGLIMENEISDEIHISYYGMMEHQTGQTIKILAGLFNDVDIVCAKAEFEVKALETLTHKPK